MRRAALGLVVALAGCSVGGGEKTIESARVDDLVLQHGDVGEAYRAAYVRNVGGVPRAEVRYTLPPSQRPRGPVTITSRASVLASEGAADSRLDASRRNLQRTGKWQPIEEPGLGDESFAATILLSGVRHYEVFWRARNVTAWLAVRAAQDELPLADVLALARRQQANIEAAET